MYTRPPHLPFIVLTDVKAGSRCVNATHVQTFIANPFGEGTLVTFANGDSFTTSDDFDALVLTLMGSHVDG
jgi:hypothetical protein